MKNKQERLNHIVNELKKLQEKGIIDRETICKFGKTGVRNPAFDEQRRKTIELCEFILTASSVDEVIEKRNSSGLFPETNMEKLKKINLLNLKESSKKTIEQYKNQDLFFDVFELGLEGELTREDLQDIINQVLGEENGNN